MDVDWQAMFERERELLDRAMEGLDHAAVFPGWQQLRQDYHQTRTLIHLEKGVETRSTSQQVD